MAKSEDDTAALAEALAGGLSAGSLEVALHAARAFHMRTPGSEAAKRVMEGLELLQAQVWFSGTDDEEDPRYSVAAQHLEAVDLPGALARYEEITEAEGASSRARGLAMSVRVVMAASAGEPLPSGAAAPEPAPAPEPPLFQDTTRIAGDGELPLSAFEDNEMTANRAAKITPEAYRDEDEEEYREEVTRHLNLGDYEIIDEEAPKKKAPPPIPNQFEGFEDEEHTAFMSPDQSRELVAKTAPKPEKPKGGAVPKPPKAPPKQEKEITRIAGANELPLDEFRRSIEASSADAKPKPPKKKAAPPPKVEKEITRIASSNELPLEELRRQMEGDDADRDLDALMEEVKPGQSAPEVSVQVEIGSARSSRAEPKPKAAPKPKPKPAPKPVAPPPSAPEPSLMLDVTVMPDFDEAGFDEDEPTPPPKAAPPKRPAVPEASVAIDISDLPDFEAEAIERAVAEAAAAEEEAAQAAQEAAAADAARAAEPLTPPPPEFTEDTPPAGIVAPPSIAAKQIVDGAPSEEEDVLYPPPEIYEEPPPIHSGLDEPTMPGVDETTPNMPPIAIPARGPVVPKPPGMGGPVVPKPPGVAGPAVPKPPGMGAPAPAMAPPPATSSPAMVAPAAPPLTSDPIHAPLESSEVALPPEAWVRSAPGQDEESENVAHVQVGHAETSWSGVESYGAHTATFEPGAEPVDADTWGDPGEGTKSAEERRAEAMVARGDLGEALRVYQDLAANHPDQPELWDRVAQIARMLQQRSG